jgi:predicted Zn-dependent protease
VERLFVDSLEQEPEDVEMRYALASYYRRSGLAAQAVLQLKRVLSSDSGHAGAWRDLGELEARQGQRKG